MAPKKWALFLILFALVPLLGAPGASAYWPYDYTPPKEAACHRGRFNIYDPFYCSVRGDHLPVGCLNTSSPLPLLPGPRSSLALEISSGPRSSP